ncbi:MAG TPA: co-chaperone GroES [Desulfobulbaceae bacterium]|uniref:Co-chaperonin GroES n=1 Tax=Caldithrix abyssi TaxID=187145 RepID=A0A7V1PVM4_CALAY|nr:co-chaperone GroES [Caldithrix abyssi]HHL32965.1 co-chaperone GroES [Desulfobulbaceae bacterium]
MNIQPLDDRVLIEKAKDEGEQKVGSIIIPDTAAKEKPTMGKVVAVGTDEDLQENIKVGDTIIYSKYAGDEIKVDDVEYLIVSRGDILATVK